MVLTTLTNWFEQSWNRVGAGRFAARMSFSLNKSIPQINPNIYINPNKSKNIQVTKSIQMNES
jgi:hypothetical protein